MSTNIVWHDASIAKEDRHEKKMDIKVLFYGLQDYRLQGNLLLRMHLRVIYLMEINK